MHTLAYDNIQLEAIGKMVSKFFEDPGIESVKVTRITLSDGTRETRFDLVNRVVKKK